MNKIRTFQAFAGYDSQLMSLDRLKETYDTFDYECVGWSEIDKYAIKAHDALYPQYADRNFGDITKIDWNQVPDFDLFTYSFPCQDISSAGNQKGLEEGSGTRSSLLWECTKAIETKKPKYLLMENVKALTQKKFMPYLNKWQDYLRDLGYSCFLKVLNAKDFGIPQNRERTFLVSILGEATYSFPAPFPLEIRLDDVLEDKVDESFYLGEKWLEKITFKRKEGASGIIEEANLHKGGQKGGVISVEGISSTLTATDYKQPKQILEVKPLNAYDDGTCRTLKSQYYKNSGANFVRKGSFGATGVIEKRFVAEPKIKQVGNLVENQKFKNPQRGRVYDPSGISPSVDTMGGGNLEPKIIEPAMITQVRNEYGKAIRKGYESGQIKEQRKNIYDLVPRQDGISNTLTAAQSKDNYIVEPTPVFVTGPSDITIGQSGEEKENHMAKFKLYPDYGYTFGTFLDWLSRQNYCGEVNCCVYDPDADGIRDTYVEFPYNGTHFLTNGITSERKDMVVRNISCEGGFGYMIFYMTIVKSEVEPSLVVKEATKKGFVEVKPDSVFCGAYPESKTRRGRLQDNGKTCPTLMASGEPMNYFDNNYRIRKLTPRECFRLMGVSDHDIDTILSSGISKTQCYKLAGNSIVVDNLFHIFRKLFIDTESEDQPTIVETKSKNVDNQQLSLFK